MSTLAGWERAGEAVCPRCQKEAVRFRANLCFDCYERLPSLLAQHLRDMGFWVKENKLELKVFFPYRDEAISLYFTKQGILFYKGGRSPIRLLFRSLETIVKQWAEKQAIPVIFDRKPRQEMFTSD